jgi:hypothetical protein
MTNLRLAISPITGDSDDKIIYAYAAGNPISYIDPLG